MAVTDFDVRMVRAWRDAADRSVIFTFANPLRAWHFYQRMQQLRESMVREQHGYAGAAQKAQIGPPFVTGALAGLTCHAVVVCPAKRVESACETGLDTRR